MAEKPAKSKARAPAGGSQVAVAKHLDMAQQRVAQFVADGTFVNLPNGKLDLDDCRIRYIRWLRDESRKSSASVSASRAQNARAEQIELQTAKELLEVIPVDEVVEFLTETIGTLRTELSGVAAASTRDPAVRAEIEKNQDAAIERCRGAFASAVQAVQGRQPIAVGTEEPDP